jgi:hypothetical protein
MQALTAGIIDPGYSWRHHFDLDKLAMLFRNFVSYENTKFTNSSIYRSLRPQLLRALRASTGSQSTAGRRLFRIQYSGRPEFSF